MMRRIVLGVALLGALGLGVAIVRFTMSSAGRPLSGDTRASFVRSANDACVGQKKADPENAGATPELIARFCDCYAETLAKRISTADLDRLTGKSPADIQAEMRPKTKDADEVCAARIDLDGK